jgi:molecular chaperone GrpE
LNTKRPPAPEDDPREDSGVLDLDAAVEEDLERATREAMAAIESLASHSGPDADAAPVAAPEAEAADAEVGQLRQEIAELRDRSVRTLADFDNYRKRAERERQDARRFAAAAPLGDLLEVLDNLRLALDAGGSSDDLKQGVELIRRQFEEILRRHGVREIAAVGEGFDPDLHEAVAREEDPAVTAPTVAAELRRGYTLHDRLLRPAMVRVAVPPAAGARGGESGGR